MGSINENLDINEAENRTGFYLLGRVPNNVTIQSLCAFGKVNTDFYDGSTDGKKVFGTITIFIVRENDESRNNEFRVRMNVTLRQSNDSLMSECIDVDFRFRSSDFFVVYIPNFCTDESSNTIICPLQVNFQSENCTIEYYDSSDTIFMSMPSRSNRVRNTVLSRQRVQLNTILNVAVTFKGN